MWKFHWKCATQITAISHIYMSFHFFIFSFFSLLDYILLSVVNLSRLSKPHAKFFCFIGHCTNTRRSFQQQQQQHAHKLILALCWIDSKFNLLVYQTKTKWIKRVRIWIHQHFTIHMKIIFDISKQRKSFDTTLRWTLVNTHFVHDREKARKAIDGFQSFSYEILIYVSFEDAKNRNDFIFHNFPNRFSFS